MKEFEKIVKFRISEKDLNILQKYAEEKGISVSQLLRDYVSNITSNYENPNIPKYVDETRNAEGKVLEKRVYSENELIDIVAQDMDSDTEEERFRKATNYVKKIGKKDVLYPYAVFGVITVFRLATDEEIAEEYKKKKAEAEANKAFAENPAFEKIIDNFKK